MFLSAITAKTFTGLDCIYELHGGCLIRSRNCLPFARASEVHSQFFGGVCVAQLCRFFLCCPILCLSFYAPCCNVHYILCIKTMFGSSLPPVVCRMARVLFTLFCFFVDSGVQYILCRVFILFFVVLCTLCCQFLWIILFDCPFGIL